MNWKQLLFPRPVRSFYKTIRRSKNKVVPRVLTKLLHLGWPYTLTSELGSRLTEGQVVLYKQGILSLIIGDRFLRFASGRSAQKLEKEYTSWKHLREHGLGLILARSMQVKRVGAATILETDRFQSIGKKDRLDVTLPIIRELVSRSKPQACGMPDT